MQLLIVFNNSFLKFLDILYTSFQDDHIEEDRLLGKFKLKIEKIIDDMEDTKRISEIFDKDVYPYIEDIFNKKNELILDNKVKFLNDIQFSSIWKRMWDSEKTVFWSNLISLCKCFSMIKACGNHLEKFDQLSRKFMQEKGNIPPEQYQAELFKEIFSGGELSTTLMETMKDSDCMQNLVDNVFTLLRNPDDDNTSTDSNDGANILKEILKMSSLFGNLTTSDSVQENQTDLDFNKFTKDLPFDKFVDKFKDMDFSKFEKNLKSSDAIKLQQLSQNPSVKALSEQLGKSLGIVD